MEETKLFYCRTSRLSKLNRYVALSLYPISGFFLLFCATRLIVEILVNLELLALHVVISILVTIFSILASYIMFTLSVKIYLFEKRQIALGQHGFLVGVHKNRQYTWNQTSNVGIIAFAATASRQSYQTQICIFLKHPNQADLKKLRDSYLYGVLHSQEFVLMEYSPCLAERIANLWGSSITDYRSLQLHRLL